MVDTAGHGEDPSLASCESAHRGTGEAVGAVQTPDDAADEGPDPAEAPPWTPDRTPGGVAVADPVTVVDAAEDPGDDEDWARPAFSLRNLTPVLLLRAAHPRQAVTTAVGMAVAAALAGRPGRELLLVLGTVLVGQAILGWFNDLVDRRRDARHQLPGKPLADGRLDPGTVWFCLALAVFLVVPLSVANGLYAAAAYLASLAIGLLGQWVWLRKGFFSWVPWAAAFALYPAFLSYGGWGGQERGAPPELLITVLAALLGIGVHFLTRAVGPGAGQRGRLDLPAAQARAADRRLPAAVGRGDLHGAGAGRARVRRHLRRARAGAALADGCCASTSVLPCSPDARSGCWQEPSSSPCRSWARAGSTRPPTRSTPPPRASTTATVEVDVLAAVVVAAQPSSGTFIASLSNNSSIEDAALESVAGAGDAEGLTFSAIDSRSRSRRAASSTSPTRTRSPSPGDFEAGQFVEVI